MITKKEYHYPSLCYNSSISLTQNSAGSPTPQKVSFSQKTTSNRSTNRNSSNVWMTCAVVLAFLFFLIAATAACPITPKSEVPKTLPTQRDSLWISPVQTRNIAFSIYVLPSLLDSLESALDTLSSTSILIPIKPRIASGTTNVPL